MPVRPSTGKAVEILLVGALQLVSDAELLSLMEETVAEETKLTRELQELKIRLQNGLNRARLFIGES